MPVREAVIRVLGGRTFHRAFDPWAGAELLIAALAEAGVVKSGVALQPNSAEWLVANLIAGDFPVEWVHTRTEAWYSSSAERFDLVVGMPPFGMPREKQTYSRNGEGVLVHDERGKLVMLEALARMADDGVCIFVSPSFDARSAPDGVYHQLHRFGLRVEAVIALPDSPFRPMTTIQGVLSVITRGTPTDVFVGRLAGDAQRDAVVVDNYRRRRSGAEVALGRLISPHEFKGIGLLEGQERVKAQARRFGYAPVPLSAVTSAMNLARKSPPFFNDVENAVYLPLIGRSAAVASQAEMSLKPHNYAQLIVKSESAVPSYVAQFFNSSLGQAIRESLTTGFIPKLSKSTLADAEVYLPPLEVQAKAIEAQRNIREVKNELNELELRVWSQPRKLDDIARRVDHFTREESFKEWLDSLPFPLASILWTYHTAGNDQKRRYEHLSHFFEALTEFVATILLSAVSQDTELFQPAKERIQKSLAGQNLTIARGTFGTWKCVYEQLAKTLRGMWAKPESKDRVERLLACRDEETLRMLTGSDLVAILQRTNGYRNSWVGHTGVVGTREAAERHRVLQGELSAIREIFSTAWDSFTLVLPRESIFTAGIHKYTVQRVVGRSAPFENFEVSLAVPMEHGYLHLLGRDEKQALRLLPLVRVMESPRSAENACYFYSRQQADGVRFVSYHFEQEADVVNQFPDTLKALESLMGATSFGREGEE